MVWYGQEGKMYATITFLALLSSWFWLRGILRGGWGYWLGYWLTVTAAMYVHLLMVLILPLHLLWFAVAWPASRQRWRGYALALAGLTLPYLPMAIWHWKMLTRAGETDRVQLYACCRRSARAGALPQPRLHAIDGTALAGADLLSLCRGRAVGRRRNRRPPRRGHACAGAGRGAMPCFWPGWSRRWLASCC